MSGGKGLTDGFAFTIHFATINTIPSSNISSPFSTFTIHFATINTYNYSININII